MVVASSRRDAPAWSSRDRRPQPALGAAGSMLAAYPGLALQVDGPRSDRALATRPAAGAALRSGARGVDGVGRRRRRRHPLMDERVASPSRVCRSTETVPAVAHRRARVPPSCNPGVIVTSLLTVSPSMTPDEFSRIWRDVHQPMSLRIHPQHTYVRNLVGARGHTRKPAVRRGVREGFESVDDVLDRSRFFGADLHERHVGDNATTIGDDIPVFLDTEHTVATVTREYRSGTSDDSRRLSVANGAAEHGQEQRMDTGWHSAAAARPLSAYHRDRSSATRQMGSTPCGPSSCSAPIRSRSSRPPAPDQRIRSRHHGHPHPLAPSPGARVAGPDHTGGERTVDSCSVSAPHTGALVEGVLGTDYEHPAAYLREYLQRAAPPPAWRALRLPRSASCTSTPPVSSGEPVSSAPRRPRPCTSAPCSRYRSASRASSPTASSPGSSGRTRSSTRSSRGST